VRNGSPEEFRKIMIPLSIPAQNGRRREVMSINRRGLNPEVEEFDGEVSRRTSDFDSIRRV